MTVDEVFDGAIAGVGTASGIRFVVGMWPVSPFGAIADVMVERPDGQRVLVAPTADVAEFIAGTYTFDEIRVEKTAFTIRGARWRVRANSVDIGFDVGSRTALGQLLSLVPRPLARSTWWCRLIDPVARLAVRGVHTVGSAGGGRTEYYCALDEHVVTAAAASLDGAEAGRLAPVRPPVRFGFGSTPARPSLVRVTTRIVGRHHLNL